LRFLQRESAQANRAAVVTSVALRFQASDGVGHLFVTVNGPLRDRQETDAETPRHYDAPLSQQESAALQ
jgi:hypothetical protein